MAGRLQLETAGQQDKFLTDDPEYSYFTQVHKKHTHFAKQNVKIVSDKKPDFDSLIRFKIAKNQGDLLSKLSFEFELDPIDLYNYGYVESVGHAAIEYIDLYIGGVMIERITTDYLQIYSEQNITQTKQYGLYKTAAKTMITTTTDDYTTNYSVINFNKPQKFVVDIPFYFYNNPELAIPICAMTDQEVEIEIKIRKLDELIIGKNFFKFQYPEIPYQAASDLNISKPILALQYIPELEPLELDGTQLNGIGVLTGENYTTRKMSPYIFGYMEDTLEFYGIVRDAALTETFALIERESVSFWRFQTNVLFKSTDPALVNKITDGRFIGTGTQFFADGTSSATVPKYNIFTVGDSVTGNVMYYVDTVETARITTLGAGYGQSIAISDDGFTIATGARNNTIKIIDSTDENVLIEKMTLYADAGAELRYTKISGNGNVVVSLDVNNSIIYVHYIKEQTTYKILALEPDCYFDVSNDGNRIIVGLNLISQYRVYIFSESGYNLEHFKGIFRSPANPVFVTISRDGNDIFYADDYLIKTESLKEFQQAYIRDFQLEAEVIFLDEYEKNIVKNSKKDFTITQIQQSPTQLVPIGEYNWTVRTDFDNVVKELYFLFQCQRYNNRLALAQCNYDNIGIDYDYQSNIAYYEHMYDLTLTLNGAEVINKDSGKTLFLKSIQSGLHHKRTPMSRRFYSYSFGTQPEKFYPTGQRNFSVIKDQLVKVNLVPQNIYRREFRIYAMSYNVLRLYKGEMRMLFPFRNAPVSTTPNGLVGSGDRIPFIFANRAGYIVPCECPDILPCPDPSQVPGDGLPMP